MGTVLVWAHLSGAFYAAWERDGPKAVPEIASIVWKD
jgi:hypothetical protein